MAIEIEKKYRLRPERMAGVEAKLGELGAEFVCRKFEENYMLRGGGLRSPGASLRLRRTGKEAVLTYKEAVGLEAGVKTKLEIETAADDADALLNITESLGLRPFVIIEKHRSKWLYRNVEVVLDELPFGLFMEIEGTAEAIAETEVLLCITDLEPELSGYTRLAIKHGTDRGGVIEARFSDSG